MSKKVKVGIWGLGRAGGGMHMREIEANKDVLEVVAVCDIDAERAEQFGKKLNVPYYSDPEKFLADKNITIKNLTKGDVTDIGSIIPLMTKD